MSIHPEQAFISGYIYTCRMRRAEILSLHPKHENLKRDIVSLHTKKVDIRMQNLNGLVHVPAPKHYVPLFSIVHF